MSASKSKVFISYSRKDREFVARLSLALEQNSRIKVFRDTEDILPTEEWKGRLEQLIAEADSFVFVLSPNSVVSEICAWELAYAEELSKRIAPIVATDVESSEIPKSLSKLNYIFFTEKDDFRRSLESLIKSLNTDVDWIREHTRLGELAARWSDNRYDRSLLLRGNDLRVAERWHLAQPSDAPEPTALHLRFIMHSQRGRRRRLALLICLSVPLAVLTVAAVLLGIFASGFIEYDEIIYGYELDDRIKRSLTENSLTISNEEVRAYYKHPFSLYGFFVTRSRIVKFKSEEGVFEKIFDVNFSNVESVSFSRRIDGVVGFNVYEIVTKDKSVFEIVLSDGSDRDKFFLQIIQDGMQ